MSKEIQERLARIEALFERVVTNDLVHIEKAIKSLDKRQDRVENKLAYYTGGLAVLIFILKFI